MNIEDIKYCVEEFKPEGFEYIEPIGEGIAQIPPCLKDPENRFLLIDEELNNSMSYSLFLQRVIESINNNIDNWYIITDLNELEIVDPFKAENYYINIDYQCIDKSKEQAIKYIVDHSRGKL